MADDLQYRHRRAALRLTAAICVGFVWIEWLLAPENFLAALGVRAGCALALLLAAQLVGRSIDRLAMLLAGATGVAMAASLAVLEGGSGAPLFAWLIAIPVIAPLIVHDDRDLVAILSALCVLAVVAVLGAEGQSIRTILVWAGSCSGSGMLAVFVATRVRTLRRRSAEAESARRAAEAELVRSEQRRIHSERLALVGQLAAGVAHEVNNPLAYVKGNLELLRDLGHAGGESAEMIEEALFGVGRIQQIVQDLRGFSRTDSEESDDVPVHELIDEAVRLSSIRVKGSGRLLHVIEPDLPEVHASRQRLVQVLTNLLVNAADALGDLPPTAERWIRIEARHEGQTVILAVEDSGPGVPPEAAERLFTPFFTTKEPGKGTGLGLALSRELIEASGGTLAWSRGEVGGARFTIELPARAPLRVAG